MGNLFAELKRRHIYRVAAAYAVVAWLLLQLFNNLAPIFELPPWLGRGFVFLLASGFPIALLFCWIQHLPQDAAAEKPKINRLDWILAGGLAAVILLIGYQQLAPNTASTAQQRGVEASKAAANSPAGAISVAVLPFVNLSGDDSQKFFSDGITEEITSALAKVPDLRVVARTSASVIAQQNRDIPDIAQQLHATHVIEGSVRKAGDRVRITVQLINGADGTHVWSQDYDRQLTDIFAIQEDIARTITASLNMSLGLRPGENLVNNRKIDPPAYQEYLRAKALVLARGQGPAEAIKILEQLTARYPDFAPAWIQLSWAYGFAQLPGRNVVSSAEVPSVLDPASVKSIAAAQRALALDANLAEGYMLLGIWKARNSLLEAQELFSKALALDPNNSETMHQYAIFVTYRGDIKDALARRQQLRALDPFVPIYNRGLAIVLWLNGQDDQAIALFNQDPTGAGAQLQLARIYAAQGRYPDAVAALRRLNTNAYPPGTVAEAIRLLQTAPAKAASPQTLPGLGILGFVYLHVGAPERVMDYYEDGIFIPPDVSLMWHPSYAPVRKTERFKAFMRKIGMVDYWRAKGWPEFCHPTSADDFVCD